MIWDVPDLQLMQDVLGHLIPLPLNKRVYFAHGPRVRASALPNCSINPPNFTYSLLTHSWCAPASST